MYKRILVPLDGSVQAEQALATAVGLASRSKAELRLLHALDFIALPPRNPAEPWWEGTARADAESYLQDLAIGIMTRHAIHVSIAVNEGGAIATILEDSK